MQTKETDNLIFSYLEGTLGHSDKQRFLEWLDTDSANLKYFSEIKAIHNHVKTSRETTPEHFRRELRRLNTTIDGRMAGFRPVRKYVAASVAACLAVFLVLGGIFLYRDMSDTDIRTYVSDSGKVMDIVLEDGTQVWLGEHSTLSYDARGFEENRHVSLVGEAIFDVSHNPASPFVVNAPGMKVKVLGTMFQINSFSETGPAEAVLAEGSIEVRNSKGGYLVTLSPGQKAIYDSEVLQVKEVRVDDLVMLRYGINTLRDASVQEIVRRLERDFDVRLKAVSYTPKDTLFTISYVKDAKVEDVLDLLETVSGSKFQIDD